MSQLTHLAQLLENSTALNNIVKTILVTIEPLILQAIEAEIKTLIQPKSE